MKEILAVLFVVLMVGILADNTEPAPVDEQTQINAPSEQTQSNGPSEPKVTREFELNTKGNAGKGYLLLTDTEHRYIDGLLNKYHMKSSTLLSDVYMSRTEIPVDTGVPFCDVLGAFDMYNEKSRWVSKFLQSVPTYSWKRIHGVTLQESCAQLPEHKEPKELKIKEALETDLLSTEVIDHIKEAASKCFSTKVAMIDIIDEVDANGQKFSDENYQEMMRLIEKCKLNELRNEIESIK